MVEKPPWLSDSVVLVVWEGKETGSSILYLGGMGW